MGWLISRLIKLFIIFIVLGIIAAVGFVFLVNPNHFKPQITQLVREYTGQPFSINGSIDWVIKPDATVNLHDIVLAKSVDDKNPAIQIKEANINFDLFSLLRSSITVKDLTLNNVIMDWALTKALSATPVTPSATPNAPAATPAAKLKAPARALLVRNFELKNGLLTLKDPTEHLNWALQNIELIATNVMMSGGQNFPNVQMQGDLVNVDHNSKYALDTTVKYDDSKNLITLDPLRVTWNETTIEGTANIDQSGPDPVVSGNMGLNPSDVGALLKKMDPYYANSTEKITHTVQMQTDYSYEVKDKILTLSKLQLQLDKGVLNGEFKLGLAGPYQAEFGINADGIDFKPIAMLGSALFPSIHTMNGIPAELLKEISVNGKMSGTNLMVGNELVIQQLHMEVAGKAGVIQFAPVIINAYGGTHNATFNIDATQHLPAFQLNEQADKVDLGPLLKAIGTDEIINGSASLKATIKANGNDLATLKQSLSGGINLYVNNGMLYGFDANRVMQFSLQTITEIFTELSSSPAANLNVLAVKRSSDWIKTQQDKPKTKFDHLEFTAQIEQGVSKQSTIAINNNVIDLKGSGQFTLSDQTINYSATMVDRLDPTTDVKVLAAYMKQTPMSLAITGTISKPVFGPDVQAYITSVLKATQTDLTNQAVNKMIAVTPPNVKTAKTASDLFIDSLQSLNK